jgi:hypothetical protein
LKIADEERRELARWTAACAARVVRFVDDARARDAIEAARAFARGKLGKADLKRHALAALAAAREADDPRAKSAARAAGYAAASPFIHALRTATQSKHILGPAVYAEQARAGELAWASAHATDTVRDVLRRFPARKRGRTALDALYYELDADLRQA